MIEIATLTYAGIFLLMIIENILIPIPSELILIGTGYLVYLQKLNFLVALFVATFASFFSALFAYFLAFLLRREKVFEFLSKLRVKKKDVKRVEKLFKEKGELIVFSARLLPGIRSLISYPAGFAKMNLKKFSVYTFAGTFLWNFLLISAGYLLGNNWHLLVSYLQNAAFVFLAIAFIGFLYRYKKK